MAMALLEEGMATGQRLTKTSRNGYSISGVDGIQWGTGKQGWMVCLFGETARRYWLSFYAYCKNCSRLDLQATLAYRDYDAGIIPKMYEQGQIEIGEKFHDKATLILSQNRGSTLYIGSRTSSQFGRVYDKHAQSKLNPLFDKCIRFEVEYKKPRSTQMAAELCRELPTQAGITDLVLNWFDHRGVIPPQVYASSDNELEIGRNVTTNEKRLEWLRKVVRNTYHQLRLAGLQSEADDAIGVTADIMTIVSRETKEK
jgi:hypothetical protein